MSAYDTRSVSNGGGHSKPYLLQCRITKSAGDSFIVKCDHEWLGVASKFGPTAGKMRATKSVRFGTPLDEGPPEYAFLPLSHQIEPLEQWSNEAVHCPIAPLAH